MTIIQLTVDKGEEKILEYCEPVGCTGRLKEETKEQGQESVDRETIVNCQLQNCQLFCREPVGFTERVLMLLQGRE